ncbi:hypothetical protein GH714_016207 [Hevea brasiliensis]|uniref:Uncharacterized protein n=1 Tax=Hevea brasiliensis TaxID=3981 RepID=A0A6A6LPA9_HEVBR|nr:hypothetical protein GH714_016207 [Hevea brasiliensis]
MKLSPAEMKVKIIGIVMAGATMKVNMVGGYSHKGGGYDGNGYSDVMILDMVIADLVAQQAWCFCWEHEELGRIEDIEKDKVEGKGEAQWASEI